MNNKTNHHGICLMKMSDKSRNNSELCRYSPFRDTMLDNRIRRIFQNPQKIAGPYLEEGMTAIDIGCGPGMFTLAMAAMVGDTGCVIAVDVQQEMLDVVKAKSDRLGFSSRIRFHQSKPETLGVSEKADFVLSFWMVHEVQDRDAFLREVRDLLKPDGKYLIVEPSMHVSSAAFADTIGAAERAGLKAVLSPHVFFSRATLFTLE